MIGTVEGEVAQGGELGLDAAESGVVGRGVGDLDVVRGGPVAHALAPFRRQVRRESVADDRYPGDDTPIGKRIPIGVS
ncbi:hypothetical protein [Micromonospora sp. RTGN7]|uniref:hypothetical protein n=1 Tax=Micromonospora sp. RTGN7 TaxID=3016526 RepID=UPI0029FECE22|nr:hypothetical protein [Micromonospora sp. RTGN7]